MPLLSREQRELIETKLRERRVSKDTYTLSARGLDILIGSRKETIKLAPGMSYPAMQALLTRIDRILDEAARARANRQQIDLEEYLNEARG